MRVLIFLAALLVAPAWADDELIPDPETLAVAPYEDGDGYVLLTFRAVTGVEGLTGYRIYHEILISFDADSTGRLVPTEPYLAWLVWGRVDAIPGADIMRVVMAVLDEDVQRFGVSSSCSRWHGPDFNDHPLPESSGCQDCSRGDFMGKSQDSRPLRIP